MQHPKPQPAAALDRAQPIRPGDTAGARHCRPSGSPLTDSGGHRLLRAGRTTTPGRRIAGTRTRVAQLFSLQTSNPPHAHTPPPTIKTRTPTGKDHRLDGPWIQAKSRVLLSIILVGQNTYTHAEAILHETHPTDPPASPCPGQDPAGAPHHAQRAARQARRGGPREGTRHQPCPVIGPADSITERLRPVLAWVGVLGGSPTVTCTR